MESNETESKSEEKNVAKNLDTSCIKPITQGAFNCDPKRTGDRQTDGRTGPMKSSN